MKAEGGRSTAGETSRVCSREVGTEEQRWKVEGDGDGIVTTETGGDGLRHKLFLNGRKRIGRDFRSAMDAGCAQGSES